LHSFSFPFLFQKASALPPPFLLSQNSEKNASGIPGTGAVKVCGNLQQSRLAGGLARRITNRQFSAILAAGKPAG